MFRGTVNDEERLTRYKEGLLDAFIACEKKNGGLSQVKCEEKVNKLFKDKGRDLLIGRISLVETRKGKFPRTVSELLGSMKEFAREKEVYRRDYFEKSVLLSELKDRRKKMIRRWSVVEWRMKKVENDIDTNRPIYSFDVVLGRDGLLFIRDVTDYAFWNRYRESGTANDFTQNTRMTRVFRIMTHHVKTLFHSNYHHKEEDDSFLPASNLNEIRSNADYDLYRLVRHQLDCFCDRVVRVKRGKWSKPNCNPEGVLVYADSFLKVLYDNGLVKKKFVKHYAEFIDNQRTEFVCANADSSAIRSSFLLQNNLLAWITFGFLFCISANDIVEFLFKDYQEWSYVAKWILVVFSFCVAVIIHLYITRRYIALGFRVPKRSSDSWVMRMLALNINSCRHRLSCAYSIRIWLINVKLLMGEKTRTIVKMLLLLLLLTVVVVGAAYWLNCLGNPNPPTFVTFFVDL